MSFTLSTLEGYLPFTRVNLPLKTAPWSKSDQMENWASLFEILMAFQRKNDTQDTTIAGIVGGGFPGGYGSVWGTYNCTLSTTVDFNGATVGTLLNVTNASGTLTVTNAGDYVVFGFVEGEILGSTSSHSGYSPSGIVGKLMLNGVATIQNAAGIDQPNHVLSVNTTTGVPNAWGANLGARTIGLLKIITMSAGDTMGLRIVSGVGNNLSGVAGLLVFRIQ